MKSKNGRKIFSIYILPQDMQVIEALITSSGGLSRNSVIIAMLRFANLSMKDMTPEEITQMVLDSRAVDDALKVRSVG